MFKTKSNLRRNPKHKEPKNTKKSSQYVEDYNEVILNDLVQDNKSDNEDNVQEEPMRKKKKSINFNLGTKKKSNSNDDNKKTKNLNKKHKSNSDQPKEIIDVEGKKDKTPTTSQPKESKSKQIQKDSNKSSKKKSKNKPSEESTKKSNKKTSKKSSKPVKEDKEKNKKSSKKSRKENELKTKSVEDLNIGELEEVNNEDNIVEGSIFRSGEQEKEIINEVDELEYQKDQVIEHKFDDIIWSDDKFPKN